MTLTELLTKDDQEYIKKRLIRDNPYYHKGIKLSLIIKLLNNFNRIDTCWIWNGATTKDGYSVFRFGQKVISTHRFFYELFKDKIQSNLTIDHLCRNRNCINPEHLEVVTQSENVSRGWKHKWLNE